jgi:uncharacterized membrane protein
MWVLWWVFLAIDELVPTERLLGREIRGLGVVLVLVVALVVGFLTSDPWVRRGIRWVEDLLLRIPLFRLVYAAFRDFASALLVKKRFDKPVLVRIGGGFDADIIGFVTCETLESFGILDKVAVYFPQSYNIAGNVLLLPRERLRPLDADSALVLSFLVSGGVTSTQAKRDPSPTPEPQGAMSLRGLLRRG